MGGRLRQAVLTLLRLHGLCGERKALMAASHLCLKRGTSKNNQLCYTELKLIH